VHALIRLVLEHRKCRRPRPDGATVGCLDSGVREHLCDRAVRSAIGSALERRPDRCRLAVAVRHEPPVIVPRVASRSRTRIDATFPSGVLGVLPVRAVTLPLLPGDGTLHGEEKLAVVIVAGSVVRALRRAHEPRVAPLERVPQFGLRETLFATDAILEGDDNPGCLAVLARLDDAAQLPLAPVLRAGDVLLDDRSLSI
jgi:hypothetical protein